MIINIEIPIGYPATAGAVIGYWLGFAQAYKEINEKYYTGSFTNKVLKLSFFSITGFYALGISTSFIERLIRNGDGPWLLLFVPPITAAVVNHKLTK